MVNQRSKGNQITKLSKEFIIKLVLTLVLLACTIIIVTFAEGREEMKYRSYVVKSGDTLWSLAYSCSKEMSIPDTIDIIRNKNHIIGTTIYCGQIIELPISN